MMHNVDMLKMRKTLTVIFAFSFPIFRTSPKTIVEVNKWKKIDSIIKTKFSSFHYML